MKWVIDILDPIKRIMRNVCVLVVTSLLLSACLGRQAKESHVKTQNPILTRLEIIKGQGVLFGHQDDLAYGMKWSYVDGESDVKRVAGDYPSLFGWELGGVELAHTHNLDSVPFGEMRRLAVKAHAMGGINTFSWHPFSPIDSIHSWHGDSVVVKHIIEGGAFHSHFVRQLDKVADFLLSLKDEKGAGLPFIFRPWHEMDGDWFWWGSGSCTPEEFKLLFRFTIDYLRQEKGLDQMVVAYSPDRNFNTIDGYLTWYPGDSVVDILGVDNYGDFKRRNGERDVIRKLHIVINAAKEKGMPAALTETGLENVTDSTWFTNKLGSVLSDSLVNSELRYVMVWRSDPRVHFFFPFPGHAAAPDAKAFLDRKDVLLLQDLNRIK